MSVDGKRGLTKGSREEHGKRMREVWAARNGGRTQKLAEAAELQRRKAEALDWLEASLLEYQPMRYGIPPATKYVIVRQGYGASSPHATLLEAIEAEMRKEVGNG